MLWFRRGRIGGKSYKSRISLSQNETLALFAPIRCHPPYMLPLGATHLTWPHLVPPTCRSAFGAVHLVPPTLQSGLRFQPAEVSGQWFSPEQAAVAQKPENLMQLGATHFANAVGVTHLAVSSLLSDQWPLGRCHPPCRPRSGLNCYQLVANGSRQCDPLSFKNLRI